MSLARLKAGAEVVGPVPAVDEALRLLDRRPELDGAVLDTSVQGGRVYAVVDVLAARDAPFVFATRYDAMVVPKAYSKAPRCEKPVDSQKLLGVLAANLPLMSR